MRVDEIISKCQKRDRQAERMLYDLFAGKILALCRRYSRPNMSLMDLHQECFMQIFNQIKKFDVNRGSFEAWIYKVSINRILQILRKNKKSFDIFYVADPPDLIEKNVEELWEDLCFNTLVEFIAQLPSGYQTVFNLYALDGWSHEEIGKALEIKTSTSRSQYSRARAMLQQIILKSIKKKYESRSA